MPEIEVNGTRYMINKMNVFDQAHVARKVAPIWFSMGKGYADAIMRQQAESGYTNGSDGDGSIATGTMFDVAMPVSQLLAKMEDDDVDYVLKKCLSVCSRWNGQGWARMMQGNNLMFQDLDLNTLINLAMSVVTENLGPFLPGLLAQASAGEDSPTPLTS